MHFSPPGQTVPNCCVQTRHCPCPQGAGSSPFLGKGAHPEPSPPHPANRAKPQAGFNPTQSCASDSSLHTPGGQLPAWSLWACEMERRQQSPHRGDNLRAASSRAQPDPTLLHSPRDRSPLDRATADADACLRSLRPCRRRLRIARQAPCLPLWPLSLGSSKGPQSARKARAFHCLYNVPFQTPPCSHPCRSLICKRWRRACKPVRSCNLPLKH